MENIFIYSIRCAAKHPPHQNRHDTVAGFDFADLYQLPPKPVLS